MEIGEGKFDQEIENCLLRAQMTRDRESLRLISFALFSGSRKSFCMNKERTQLLSAIVYGESIEKIVDLIKTLLIKQKPGWGEPIKPKFTFTPKQQAIIAQEEKEELEAELNGSTWCDKTGYDKTKMVYISHGGGLYYIRQFLTGLTEGYEASEFNGKGVFVSPTTKPGSSEFSDYYANWKPQHFDIPAKFMAEIEARHLGAVKNENEAVLRKDKIKYLKNISIEICPVSTNSWKY